MKLSILVESDPRLFVWHGLSFEDRMEWTHKLLEAGESEMYVMYKLLAEVVREYCPDFMLRFFLMEINEHVKLDEVIDLVTQGKIVAIGMAYDHVTPSEQESVAERNRRRLEEAKAKGYHFLMNRSVNGSYHEVMNFMLLYRNH